jgi:hypothetical protein
VERPDVLVCYEAEPDERRRRAIASGASRATYGGGFQDFGWRHQLPVLFGVRAFELESFSQVHASSGVQVHGHDAEQVLGWFAHGL